MVKSARADEPTDHMLALQALICQALGDPKRLRLLHLLEAGELSVGELAASLGASVANTSQHLAVLRNRGLVRTRRAGTSVYYALAYPEILQACRTLQEILLRQIETGGELTRVLPPDA